MTVWFARDGRQIDEGEASVRTGDPAYYEVGRTVVAEAGDAAKSFEVYTIWLGMNIAEQVGKVELFETVVFDAGGLGVHTHGYATECQAIVGHDAVVTRLAGGMTSPVVEHIRSVLHRPAHIPT